jgi:hypothetical protein
MLRYTYSCHIMTLLLLMTLQSNGLLGERYQRAGHLCWDIHTIFTETLMWFNISNHEIDGNTVENVLLRFRLVVLRVRSHYCSRWGGHINDSVTVVTCLHICPYKTEKLFIVNVCHFVFTDLHSCIHKYTYMNMHTCMFVYICIHALF